MPRFVATAAASLPQSALDPAGPAAEAIAFTWWLMAGVAGAVWIGVVGLLLWTMRRRRRAGTGPGEKLVVLGGIVLPTVVLAALLAYGTATSDAITGMGAAPDEVIEVRARQWQWEFTYLDARGQPVAHSIDELVLPRGRLVEFHVTSADVIHSFWIPRLGGKIDAIPGRTNRLRLRADRTGPMRGQCAEFCGARHALMAFEVSVLEAADYRAWRQAQAGGRR